MELFYKIHLLQIYVNYNASDYDQLFKDYCFNRICNAYHHSPHYVSYVNYFHLPYYDNG